MRLEAGRGEDDGRWVRWIMLLLGVITLALAVHRASTASFTHDESYSYLRYPHQSFGDILRHKEAFTNNHLLNTMGMKYAELLFGPSELALRIPNLLALVLFLMYGARLLRSLPPMLAVGGFVLLCTNSYLLELFTLARGYGLSFGFFMMAQFHLVRAISSGRGRHVVWFHVASMLAALSNFTLLTAYVAGLLVYYGAVIAVPTQDATLRARRRASNRVQVVMVVLSVLVLWEPVRKVRIDNDFNFGGGRTFLDSTVVTWIDAALPGVWVTPTLSLVMGVVLALLVFVPCAFVVRGLVQRNAVFFVKHLALVVVAITFIATCVGAELQHMLLHVDHLEGRFAMFLYPSLLLLLPHLLELLQERNHRLIASGIMLGAVLWTLPTFLLHFGPYKSVEWSYDVRTKDAMVVLVADHEAHGKGQGPVRIGNTWLFEPTMNYYRCVWNLDWLEPVDRSDLGAEDQYRYVNIGDAPPGYATDFALLATFRESGSVLLKRTRTTLDLPNR